MSNPQRFIHDFERQLSMGALNGQHLRTNEGIYMINGSYMRGPNLERYMEGRQAACYERGSGMAAADIHNLPTQIY